ncbi:MAG: hypothetical protein COT36_00485 [Parcubacteria group bacterium CG08_land_8_20_14_0_20_38_56]|nr:MAG: hypothetical protein COT36_00485 [Parcubacteria group bacterium CG08_land_8_20_14_0_20_38_56]
MSQEQKIIKVVKKVSPAVVSIIVTKDLPVIEQYWGDTSEEFFGEGDDFFKFFSPFEFKQPQYRQKGTEKREVGGGTGFVVSNSSANESLILTNKHVVSDKSAEYTVLTNDGQKIPAKILALDPFQDIAVLKVEKPDLPTVTLGDSDKLEIGQTVIAIGNALGEFRNTVSVGVISGLARNVVASGGGVSEQIEDVIQTDAAINQGNSGGPLLNTGGEVIGINVAMALGAENIGFSIPGNNAKKALRDIQKFGKISYPYLGIRYFLINKEIQEKNNLSVDYGALIQRGKNPEELAIMPGSPADKAGLVENDIVLELSGQKITPENSLAKLIRKRKVGEEITLKVLRKGEEKEVKVVLDEWKL